MRQDVFEELSIAVYFERALENLKTDVYAG